MRIDADGTVVLSKRNLLALLHKLEMEGSSRTLTRRLEGGHFMTVRAEDDLTHYNAEDRQDLGPGRMAPETEEFIRSHS
jgi:hypothetical protein